VTAGGCEARTVYSKCCGDRCKLTFRRWKEEHTQRIGSKDTSGARAAKGSACLMITVAALSTEAEDGWVTVARKVKFANPPVRRVRFEMGRKVLET